LIVFVREDSRGVEMSLLRRFLSINRFLEFNKRLKTDSFPAPGSSFGATFDRAGSLNSVFSMSFDTLSSLGVEFGGKIVAFPFIQMYLSEFSDVTQAI